MMVNDHWSYRSYDGHRGQRMVIDDRMVKEESKNGRFLVIWRRGQLQTQSGCHNEKKLGVFKVKSAGVIIR